MRLPKGMVRGCALVAGALVATLLAPGLPAGATPNAATLYRQALATTTSWSVHYASDGIVSKVSILTSGDAGPASGTQEVLVSHGNVNDNASLIVIGDITYVKGNTRALIDLTGLSPAQAAANQGKWVLFSTNNPTFAQVVVGVRSHDVAQELALKGPYTLGPSRKLGGYEVDAIHGTQQLQGLKAMHAVLYVRATGRHLVVEEDTLTARGKPNGIEHTVFSKWGEEVRPMAPAASITLGPVSVT